MVYSTDLRKKNNEEIADIIYDTLMENSQHKQFSLGKVGCAFIDRNKSIIRFTYGKHTYDLTIT